MKKHLEYIDEKSSKFWKIEVIENSHTVSYGKIGTNGQTSTKEFTTVEAAKKHAETLVKAKLKKGYHLIDMEEESPLEDAQEKWFERLSHKIFTIYKAAILKYPLKEYTYIQLNWTGQGFALGLSTNPRSGDHEYIEGGDWHNEDDTSIESVYRLLEDIPYEEYDEDDDCEYEVEFEREEWPTDSSDCYYLEYFLINVALGLAYMKLENDTEVKKYLEKMEVIIIVSVDKELGSFSYHIPSENTKLNVVNALLKNDKEKQLVLDLWNKEAKNTGITFLNHFKRVVTKIKDMPKLTLKEAQAQAHDLVVRFRDEEAIEVLKPVLKSALNDTENYDPVLLEKSCDVMGEASINVKESGKESIYWFKKGLEFVPNGHSAISLMSMYSLYLDDEKALIDFCNEHLNTIDIMDNVDHTTECYRYLGKGYLALGDKEKATATYKTLFNFLTQVNQTWRLDYPIEDIEDFIDSKKRLNEFSKKNKYDHGFASEILTWFKTTD